jgi:hypothetical protein
MIIEKVSVRLLVSCIPAKYQILTVMYLCQLQTILTILINKRHCLIMGGTQSGMLTSECEAEADLHFVSALTCSCKSGYEAGLIIGSQLS